MEIMAVVKLILVVLSVVEMVKRFIPDKKRTYVNPVLAVVTGIMGAYYMGGNQEVLNLLYTGLLAGIMGAYYMGGNQEVLNLLYTGLLAGAGAMGTYKIPKEIASKLGID